MDIGLWRDIIDLWRAGERDVAEALCRDYFPDADLSALTDAEVR